MPLKSPLKSEANKRPVNVCCLLLGHPGQRIAGAPACQPAFIYVWEAEAVLFMFEKLNWQCQDIIRDAAAVSTQRLLLLPFSLENIWESLFWKERKNALHTGGKMAPFSIWNSVSQCGRTCVHFQHYRADDKIAYTKKERRLQSVSLLGGPQARDILGLRGIISVFLSSFFLCSGSADIWGH